MNIDDKEYAKLIKQLATYRAALRVISVIGVGAYTDVDGWSHLAKQAQKTAYSALIDGGNYN